ncbi:MAG: response regulator transcription factor [Candidatus Cloacimonetes bacterium]|nr:response regulator transcription factor [Candidatus Cloacimonadota bacterium]MCF7814650.1 response regulator transcription factor [Candidatus Cloacimonadota bacterium]MCF7869404.1 response regulator transcription factor [Candidatus Cloacimonadota bacterium]MCF7884564.1 response regulator transcription factor [Candidatus Cloacimonadota bacterium]
MIRILVADDHPVVRKGIVKILKDFSKTFLIDEVDNAREALKKAKKHDYELILLDISMPFGGGFKALEQILAIKPKSKIIMLSVFDDKQYVVHSLKMGAKAYLTKSCAAEELEKAVKKVRAGEKYLSIDLAEKIALNIDNDKGAKHEALTKREFQVFCLIAKGKKTGEIAKELSISPKTVTTYRSRILEKMDMKSTYDIIKYALSNQLTEKIIF